MPHDYETLFRKEDAEILQDMDNAVTECKMWDWLKTFEPEKGKGFMFTIHPNINEISSKMNYGGHSGASFAWCMRNMEAVAKKGWETYRADILEARAKKTKETLDNLIEIFASSSNPEKRNQATAMRQFTNGQLSYAEMRRLCG